MSYYDDLGLTHLKPEELMDVSLESCVFSDKLQYLLRSDGEIVNKSKAFENISQQTDCKLYTVITNNQGANHYKITEMYWQIIKRTEKY